MNKRDKAILDDLIRFRVMSRDDIAEIHFKELKNPITSANLVLKRLTRDGYIKSDNTRRQYIYSHIDNTIKKDSSKIPHFLEIVRAYKEMCRIEKPSKFIVEPRYGKGLAQPDSLVVWRKIIFFLEVQTSRISKNDLNDKINRYEELKSSSLCEDEFWYPSFPNVIFLTPHRFEFESSIVKFIQVDSVKELNERISKMFQERKITNTGIQIKIKKEK